MKYLVFVLLTSFSTSAWACGVFELYDVVEKRVQQIALDGGAKSFFMEIGKQNGDLENYLFSFVDESGTTWLGTATGSKGRCKYVGGGWGTAQERSTTETL